MVLEVYEMDWIKRAILRWMIGSAGASELTEISKAVIYRYAELFAEEEVIFLSLPKNDRLERRRIISAVLEMEDHK